MRKDLLRNAIKMTNGQLRQHNSALRKNLRLVISCSADNEKAQERVDEIEEMIAESASMKSMFDAIITQGKRVFEIDVISITLDPEFEAYYPPGYHDDGKRVYLGAENVIFAPPSTYVPYFPEPYDPIIRGGLHRGTDAFFPEGICKTVRSEALAPLTGSGGLLGVIAFGSRKPGRYTEGHGARFLKRLARTTVLKMEYFRATAMNPAPEPVDDLATSAPEIVN